jgi:RimJ/RimL family protein N-acetyltransferase
MTVLTGKYVRLEPLSVAHSKDLWESTGGDNELWKWVLVKFAIPNNENEMEQLIKSMVAEKLDNDREPWAVIDLRNNKCIGSTSYLDIKVERKTLEIGSTFYGAIARRTAINTETKFLLLSEAFDNRGYERVQLKADNLNEVSLRAIERIGAKKEGVLRNHFLRRDGSRRDTVMYSIIRSEWPEIASNLQSKLNR